MCQDDSVLTPEVLLAGYCRGIFPMADPDTDEILWFDPPRRGIISIEHFQLRRSDRKILKRGDFDIRADSAFEDVMRACADERRPGGWINEEIIAAYVRLHEIGYAHSVEAWRGGRLVGGLYGVAIRAGFFGESMFVRPEQGGTNASKIALAWLVAHLRARGYTLLDTQFTTPHLKRLGCLEISRAAYRNRLAQALSRETADWGRFPAAVPAT